VLTGAAGTIGSALRRPLRERAGRLRLVDVQPPADPAENEEVVLADIRELDRLTEAFSGASRVIHLAGIPDEADFHELAETNIVGTYHALEASRRNGVGRFVFASSNHVTGFYAVGEHLTPDVPPRPDGFYGVSKVAGEALCRLYHDKFGLAVACLRIGSFEATPSEPRHLSTWLSPADAVKAFIAATTAENLGFAAFYVVSANSHNWWDLDAGRKLGFEPQDRVDAHVDAQAEALPESSGPQGGEYASAAYSLERMRR
jgi:nucleoside-diphosphate-sugar epimerase